MVKATSSGEIIQQSEKAMWKHIYINIYTLMFIHWMVLSKKKGPKPISPLCHALNYQTPYQAYKLSTGLVIFLLLPVTEKRLIIYY